MDRLFTFGYFIPTMVTLMSVDALPQAEAVPLAMQWQSLDVVRDVLSLLAFLAALKALSVAEPRADVWPAELGSARAPVLADHTPSA